MSLRYIYILCLCTTCFGHAGPSTGNTFLRNPIALCTLSIVLVKYVVIIINFGVIGCLFFLSFILRPLCGPLGVPLFWLCVSCVDMCSLYCTTVQIQYNTKDRKNKNPIAPKLITTTMTFFKYYLTMCTVQWIP
jgi:FtsH-binding integral membrane protein